MSNFPDNWPDIAWAKLSPELRQRAVDHINAITTRSEREEVRRIITAQTKDPWWHFTGGMAVRNRLREVIKDDELPPLPEFYGTDQSTWDDFYVQCIEAALGLREI